MVVLVISVSSDSSKEKIPNVLPTVLPTVPPSPDHTPALLNITPASPDYSPVSYDYSPASPDYSTTFDIESVPSEDLSSDHIPPLPAILPFLSSADDTTERDTPDTPPSPNHDDSARDSSSDSSSEASSDLHSDASSDSSLRHSLLDHSSLDLSSTIAGPSHKRRRSPMTLVPALSPVSGALSPVYVDLIPSPKRVRDSGYLAYVEDIDPEVQAKINECIAYADALRDRGINARVAVEAVDQEESEMGTRGSVEVIEGVQREQGCRIVEVESAVTNLTKRIAELERDNRNGNRGNRNGGWDRNGNRNMNHGMNYEGFLPVAQECMFQDFLKCKPYNFSGTKGIVGLTRSFEKMETMFNINNYPSKYQVKYATCTLQDNVFTWWNSHKRTIGVDVGYAMKWARLMRMVSDEEDKVERFIGVLPDNIQRAMVRNHLGIICYECGRPGHFRKDGAKLRNQNRGNQTGNKNGNNTGSDEATSKSYAIEGGANPDSNVVMDTSYAVELADGRILETNVVLRDCTLGLLGHPFEIDLIPVELGSFDVIIGMDWLAKYQALIVCDKKVVRIPYEDEVLIILDDDCEGEMQVTYEKAEDMSEEKRLEDVPIVQEFPEVFPKDMPGLTPAQQVEF
nr:reverse transcriptase domain-containing protein [Tanacetum cinerariifolium]